MNTTDNQKPIDEAQREAVLRCTDLLGIRRIFNDLQASKINAKIVRFPLTLSQ